MPEKDSTVIIKGDEGEITKLNNKRKKKKRGGGENTSVENRKGRGVRISRMSV